MSQPRRGLRKWRDSQAGRGAGLSAVEAAAARTLAGGEKEVVNRPPKPAAFSGAGWMLLRVATLGVAALTVAAYLGKLGWLFELTSHFRVQYGALLTFAMLCFLAGGRWRAALAAGLFAAANLCLIVPLGSPPPLAHGRHAVRLVEANVYANNRDHQRLLDFVRATKPDMVLVIEVSFAWAQALRALEADFPYRRVIAANHSFGLAIFSRAPLDDLEVRPLGDQNIALAIKARFTLDGQRITFIGAHPYSPTSAAHFADRNRQFKDLAALVRREPGPTVLMGDLNVSPWSPYFQDLLSASRLVDSRRAFGIQATWPTLFPLMRIPIDHCLVSPELAVNQRMVGPNIGSDHLPIVVDLSLAEAAAAPE